MKFLSILLIENQKMSRGKFKILLVEMEGWMSHGLGLNMKIELKQHFRIESARFLPRLPETHPCRRMHGHSFEISLRLCGEIDPQIGWLRDFNEIELLAKPLLSQLDHQVLNEVPGLENPTSEHLCIWLYDQLKKQIPELIQVSVAETPHTQCSYPSI